MLVFPSLNVVEHFVLDCLVNEGLKQVVTHLNVLLDLVVYLVEEAWE